MIGTMLVPLDGSEAAETILPYVQLVASSIGSPVRLLTVVREHGDEAGVRETRTYLEKRTQALRGRSLSCSARVTAGDEAQAILAEADEDDVDLIAMSTHGRSGLMRWVLGSVAGKVIHGTSKPLLLARARETEKGPPPLIERILVPLDGSPLSRSVVPYVEEMAVALDAGLVLHNAVPPLDVYPGVEVMPARVGGLIDDLLAQGQSFLADVAKEIEGRGKVGVHSTVTVGFPVEEITRVAHETKVGLIAMATHGRSGVNRWVMGSVADGVVRRSPLPCLLVRPRGVPGEEP
jgi:nucleotide-binding universal stress UspA family protein